MRQLNVTELDFDQIKNNLKDYFRNKPGNEYEDWDFEGSGLNQLIDILAYNTHYNAIVAHNAMNESFIDSAQIRSNVVSRAKLLGYTPRSQTSSMARVRLVFPSSVNSNLSTFTLYRGNSFTTNADGETFTYITRDDYTAVLDDINFQYVFEDVVIYEGEMIENTFIVESGSKDQKFIIEDNTIDLEHATVNVYENAFSNAFETYSEFKSLSGVAPDSPVYFINENFNGNYEIKFGDNIFGKRPEPLSVIRVAYLSTRGAASNGANVFRFASPGAVGPETITTLSPSTNGSAKEDIESIRHNAPLSFVAQNRAVTATDYKTLITQMVNNVETISVWGGEDNVPPQYGRVFISIKPYNAETLTELDKTFLLRDLMEKRIIGIEPVIVDPEYTYLYLDVLLKYDTNRTSFSSGQLQSKVENLLVDFNAKNLQKFDGVFRYSHLLSEIDNLDVSIINSFARVYLYRKAKFSYGALVPTPVDFKLQLYGNKTDSETKIESDSWVYNGVTLRLEDTYLNTSDDRRVIRAFTIGENGVKKIVSKDVGTVDLETGLISIYNLPINRDETINIYVTPASNDIVSKRNNLLSIDIGKTVITPEVDTIVVSGSSGVEDYTPFLRHRNTNS